MTHRSLFKEVAQRIVQRAQSPENEGHSQGPGHATPALARHPAAPVQMAGSTFAGANPHLTSPPDTTAAPQP